MQVPPQCAACDWSADGPAGEGDLAAHELVAKWQGEILDVGSGSGSLVPCAMCLQMLQLVVLGLWYACLLHVAGMATGGLKRSACKLASMAADSAAGCAADASRGQCKARSWLLYRQPSHLSGYVLSKP